MIIKPEESHLYRFYDAEYKAIHYVHSFNVDTCEISLYIPRVNLGGVVTEKIDGKTLPKLVTFILKGAYAVDEKGNKLSSNSP